MSREGPKGWDPEGMAKRARPYNEAFWQIIRGDDAAGRLAALIRFATVVLPGREAIRRHLRWRSRRHARAGVGRCWACESQGPLVWHHIIQLQHGGTNARHNQVAICTACHAHIHPHLPMPSVANDVMALQARQRCKRPFDARARLVKKH